MLRTTSAVQIAYCKCSAAPLHIMLTCGVFIALTQVSMAKTGIVGANGGARESNYLSGNAEAIVTMFVPKDCGNNIAKAIAAEETTKKLRMPQRKVGETFAFLELVIESEVSSTTC